MVEGLEPHRLGAAATRGVYEVATPRSHVAGEFPKRSRYAERLALTTWNASWRRRVVDDREAPLVERCNVAANRRSLGARKASTLVHNDQAPVVRGEVRIGAPAGGSRCARPGVGGASCYQHRDACREDSSVPHRRIVAGFRQRPTSAGGESAVSLPQRNHDAGA
jgi:hypothetical protein